MTFYEYLIKRIHLATSKGLAHLEKKLAGAEMTFYEYIKYNEFEKGTSKTIRAFRFGAGMDFAALL